MSKKVTDKERYKRFLEFEKFLREELHLSSYGAAAVIYYIRTHVLCS